VTPVISQLIGPGEEASRLPGLDVAGQHLVVADVDQLALVHLRGVGVGLDPQRAGGVEGDAVGAGEEVALDVALGLGPGLRRVAGQHQVVPAKAAPSKSPSSFQRMIWPMRCWRADWPRPRPAGPGRRGACCW
jgi:hypothetical protein